MWVELVWHSHSGSSAHSFCGYSLVGSVALVYWSDSATNEGPLITTDTKCRKLKRFLTITASVRKKFIYMYGHTVQDHSGGSLKLDTGINLDCAISLNELKSQWQLCTHVFSEQGIVRCRWCWQQAKRCCIHISFSTGPVQSRLVSCWCWCRRCNRNWFPISVLTWGCWNVASTVWSRHEARRHLTVK